MNKVHPDAKSALAGVVKDGLMIMSGECGLRGVAEVLSDALRESGANNLTVVCRVGASSLINPQPIKQNRGDADGAIS
jgi:3-oxoacid CoA-transferase subunit A